VTFFVIDNNGYHGRIRQQKKKEYIVLNMLLKVEAMEIGPPVRTKKFFFFCSHGYTIHLMLYQAIVVTESKQMGVI
jgi:hypothetical protein